MEIQLSCIDPNREPQGRIPGIFKSVVNYAKRAEKHAQKVDSQLKLLNKNWHADIIDPKPLQKTLDLIKQISNEVVIEVANVIEPEPGLTAAETAKKLLNAY